MSTISIIGTGSMASALAGRALAGGNEVEIIGRNATKAKELAAALGGATHLGLVAHSVKHTNFFLGVNILN